MSSGAANDCVYWFLDIKVSENQSGKALAAILLNSWFIQCLVRPVDWLSP